MTSDSYQQFMRKSKYGPYYENKCKICGIETDKTDIYK